MTHISVEFSSEGRCLISHSPSGNSIVTDLPPEYGGNAQNFSSTDLVAAALGSCVFSSLEKVMVRESLEPGLFFISVEKEISHSPRMIKRLTVVIEYQKKLSDLQLKKLKKAAAACPVKRSLHTDVSISLIFKDSNGEC
ncbi:MAG: OsmC family protein [Kangiellaceae bacterium]|nr:OsmC family protein [Kangiellaceae bacterium]MCW8998883.1 OsmC family protein [Kangiellaceae bacterium]